MTTDAYLYAKTIRYTYNNITLYDRRTHFPSRSIAVLIINIMQFRFQNDNSETQTVYTIRLTSVKVNITF